MWNKSLNWRQELLAFFFWFKIDQEKCIKKVEYGDIWNTSLQWSQHLPSKLKMFSFLKSVWKFK